MGFTVNMESGAWKAPYATISHAAQTAPGSLIIVREGDYKSFELGPECSGSKDSPTVIRPAEGAKVVIHVEGETCIFLKNVHDISIEGLEVATEHSPEENELFKVSGISVHDNVIADCTGFAGLAFGGYERDLGFTEDCIFDNNTLVDNPYQIVVQRSRKNRICANLVLGGEEGIFFEPACREEGQVNEISGNAAAETEN